MWRLLGVALIVSAATAPLVALPAALSDADRPADRLPVATDAAGRAAEGSAAGRAQQVPAPPAETPALSPELEATARTLASQLRCPVCEALSIQDSPTEMAQDMRGVIRDQLAAGRTADQVRAYFVDTYGEWVLLEPQARGFNLLAYLLPVLVLLTGAGLVVRSVRRWSRAGAGRTESA